MADEKLLNIRDVSIILGINEKEVIELSESGAIPAYKIGGVYLRFKRQQIEDYRRKNKIASHKHDISLNRSINDKIGDFVYFNDFYILSILIIAILLIIIFQGY